MEIWQSPIQYGQNHGLSWPALLLVVVWLVVCVCVRVSMCASGLFCFFHIACEHGGRGVGEGITAMWQTHVWAVCSLCFNSRLCHARSRPLLPLSPSVSSFSALRHLLRSSFHLVLALFPLRCWAQLRHYRESRPEHRLYPVPEFTWTRVCFSSHAHHVFFQLRCKQTVVATSVITNNILDFLSSVLNIQIHLLFFCKYRWTISMFCFECSITKG